MRIARLEVIDLAIPFRFTFRHALSARAEGASVLVRAEDEAGTVGWGECVPRDYVTGETPESARAALRDHFLPRFLGRTFDSFSAAAAALTAEVERLPRRCHAAFCALELALLDVAGRRFDAAAGSVLGDIATPEVAYSGVVSADGVAATRAILEQMAHFRFAAVKLKVGTDPQVDRQVLENARRILGDAVSLRVDANCAWTKEAALRELEALHAFRLDGAEQPLAADDLDGLAWLTERSPVQVIADESLCSIDDARRLAEARACHVFNVRVSKCGGLINSGRIRDLGRAAGIACQLGAQVGETAILSAAGRQFATRSVPPPCFLEGSYGTLLLDGDIGRVDLTLGPGGRAPALAGSGLGIEIDEQAVLRHRRQ